MGARLLKKLILAALAVVGSCLSPIASAAPPVEAFGSLPAVQSISISPSGKYFAIVQNMPGQSAVKTFDALTLQQIGGIAAGKQQRIGGVAWHSDDRLIVTVVEVVKIAEYITDELKGTNLCRMMSIPRDGKNPVQILPKGMMKGQYLSCDLVALHGPTPNSILIQDGVVGGSGLNSKSQIKIDQRVHSVDVVTGVAEVLPEVGNRNTTSWGADPKGNVRLRFDRLGGDIAMFARLDGSKDWVEFHRQPAYEFESMPTSTASKVGVIFPSGFADDPNKLLVVYWPGDKQALGLFDLRTKQITQLFADPKYDVDGPIRRAKRLVGAFVSRAMPEQVFFDEEWRKLQAHIVSNYPGHRVQITSSSEDRNKHALFVEGPKWPGGAFLVLDVKASEATLVSAAYPNVDLASTGEQKYITYAARDGMNIDAYLTVPRGSGKNLAAIVLPHGGPAARDDGGFDWLSQFFASRGYAVLQPQYRGSTGFGTNFARAGEREWGLKMQNDVSDGVKYLVSSGIADPSKICIMGWSYGGYAAMAGATLTPELYRCAIAGAGVSDLIEMQLWTQKFNFEQNDSREGAPRYWRHHIGDTNADRAKLLAASPAKQAQKVRAPMLLIHGELDNVVPIQQSELMANALKAAGKPYEFVRLADENHNMSFASTRIKTLKAMDEFLAKHNPAR